MILTAKIVHLEEGIRAPLQTHALLPLCFAANSRPLSRKTPNLTGSRRDGGQPRRKRESHTLSNQIEIALVREPERRQMFAYVLDQNFRRRCASGQPDATYAFKPLRVNILGIVD